jgi:hypothetical protein
VPTARRTRAATSSGGGSWGRRRLPSPSRTWSSRRRIRTVPAAVLALEEGLWPPTARRRRWRREEGASGGGDRRGRERGAEEVALVGAGQDVGVVEPLDAGVEGADAAGHGPRPDQRGGRGEGQGEEGEEEVDRVLAGLREQHAPGIGVDEELHPENGGGRRRHPLVRTLPLGGLVGGGMEWNGN